MTSTDLNGLVRLFRTKAASVRPVRDPLLKPKGKPKQIPLLSRKLTK